MGEMNRPIVSGFNLKRRVPINASSQDLVVVEAPKDGTAIPVTIRPAIKGVDILEWARIAREQIDQLLMQHGGILFREFGIENEADFQRLIEVTSGDPLPYIERSSPRSQVHGNIFTSTDYPPEHAIYLHCENSYQKSWPLRIFFYCHVQPEEGGETPIADTRRILARIDPAVREVFETKGVMYVRNFSKGLGLPWQTVFQTEDREAVEEYCKAADIHCTWYGEDRLKTWHVRKAIRKHPRLEQNVWFNHAVFFHISTLEPEAQKAIRNSMSEDEFPNNTFYGDGSPIEAQVLDHVRDAYAKETVVFPWKKGDILMLDNMLACHGRAPYRGARRILVGMTEPCSC